MKDSMRWLAQAMQWGRRATWWRGEMRSVRMYAVMGKSTMPIGTNCSLDHVTAKIEKLFLMGGGSLP